LKILLALFTVFLASPLQAAEFELKDGDRVVFLGNTLVEREQRYGHWEAALTARNPDKKIVFRNLGWSGDTVFGEARAGFGDVAHGFKQLKELTIELKPTVIFVAYGTNESYEGKAGLPKFTKGLETLLDTLAVTKARFVLFSPIPHEDVGRPLPEPTKANENLALYRDAIKSVAEKRKIYFADLFDLFGAGKITKRDKPLTDNGMHLTGYGYRQTTPLFLQSLGITTSSSDPEPSEELRNLIRDKNELYFYRWRPQNETYLFGFRKHEQGKNAKEVAEFDPLIAEKEKQIEAAKKK
jgi:lysophospholipase L1-like esterase